MSLLSDDLLLGGDILPPFNQSFMEAEEGLGLLDDCIEDLGHLQSHGFSSRKVKNGVSELLPLSEHFGSLQGDAFSGMDWMVEKMDLIEFDFESLLGIEDLESTILPDELMATLDDSCDLLEDPPLPSVLGQNVPSPTPGFVEGPLEADQVAPVSLSLVESDISSPDHSFILDVGSEVDVAEEDKKSSAIYTLEVTTCEKEDNSDNESGIYISQLLKSEKEDSSDNDSGIYMSPSYLESPDQSPTLTIEYPSSMQSSPASPVSERPKPYDPPSKNKEVLAKVKTVGPKVDKKKKKMEQNKTAATRYRQKKKTEQELISGECRELEQKNDDLNEKADSLAKEIQYLKDLIEEVRKAKSKRAESY